MTCWVSFLLLLAALPGVKAQIQLAQSGAEVKKPGESVKVSCKGSGYTFTSYAITWVQQIPGKGLFDIGWISTDTGAPTYRENFKGKVTMTVDKPLSTAFLQVSSLRTEDTAVYYCVRYPYQAVALFGFDVWGQGTMVTVTTASATAPSVFPLTSCTGEVTTSQVTFGCLAKGYFPEPVTVTWDPNVGSSGVRTYPSVLQPSSGLYSLSSQVTVPASSWESDTYRCTVQHPPTSSTSSTEIPKPTPIEPHAPEVEVFYSCTTNPGTVQLVCLISGFYPKALTVEWLVDGEHGLLHSELNPATKDTDGRTYSIRSNASVPQSAWLAGKTYTCQVYHEGTATTKQAHARKCEGDSPQG